MEDPSKRLRWAIINNKLAIVSRLLKRYPELLTNVDPSNGWSSLHYAGYHGHYLICVLLVQLGHDEHEISLSHDRCTPLHLTASQNHEQTVHFLAQHIPRCLDWFNSDNESALLLAARMGHDPCISLLLDFGADIDLGNSRGNRALHVAASHGHVKTLRTLVDRNADPFVKNKEGWGPIDLCATPQLVEYFKRLVREKHNSQQKQAFFKTVPKTPTKSPSSSKFPGSGSSERESVEHRRGPIPAHVPVAASSQNSQQFQNQGLYGPHVSNHGSVQSSVPTIHEAQSPSPNRVPLPHVTARSSTESEGSQRACYTPTKTSPPKISPPRLSPGIARLSPILRPSTTASNLLTSSRSSASKNPSNTSVSSADSGSNNHFVIPPYHPSRSSLQSTSSSSVSSYGQNGTNGHIGVNGNGHMPVITSPQDGSPRPRVFESAERQERETMPKTLNSTAAIRQM